MSNKVYIVSKTTEKTKEFHSSHDCIDFAMQECSKMNWITPGPQTTRPVYTIDVIEKE
ncbi:hypothetical protein [Caulobacter phage Cr30]|uniref:hypothetical protein n=1 Tax=Caulobacter phage Cr30 TaxID=1357714 RepID=UPI0004A9B59A|nr:hypothetical protein OZ74_gp286 [Caulobacter phage Cr30]AGS81057.1 hypothetical protein [Caulobacter phage Cr30]